MLIRVFQDTLIGGQWTGIGVGNFQPDIAQHLIDIGVAESYEVKVVEPIEKKTHLSASQPVPVSPPKTVRKRRTRKPKSSQ